MSPSDIRSYTHKVSPKGSLKCELNKNDTKEHANWNREKTTRPHSYTKNYRQLTKQGGKEMVFPKVYHIDWLFRAKESALKTHTGVTLC